MGNYTAFKDGYAIEASYGSTAIANTNATTYLWGVMSQESIHPSPTTTINYRATGVNAYEVPAGEHWKSFFELSGMYGVAMQNGVLCWAAMGASSTTGTDPYTHTITAPTDGSSLPSFTIQHERTGTATAWATQFLGCKIAGLHLTASFDQRILIAKVDWIAKKALDPGFTLTNDPALPATANTDPYHWGMLSLKTFNGVDMPGLTELDIFISPDFQIERAHTWDTGTYTGQWLRSLIESPRRTYKLTMTLHATNDDIWDDLVATTVTSDFVFKWARGTNDYIQVTLTDCPITRHDLITPEVGKISYSVVEAEPRSISVEVKDSIAGSAYGE